MDEKERERELKRKELERKLEEIAKEAVPPRNPDMMARCYCPVPAEETKKRVPSQTGMTHCPILRMPKLPNLFRQRKKHKSIWKRLFSKDKK